MLALVADYWLDVVVTWSRQFLDLLETLGFTHGSFEFRLLLQLVITHTCRVLADEVSPSWFWDGRTYPRLDALSYCVSAHTGMISNYAGWFCSRNSVLGAFLDRDFVGSGRRVVNDFIVGLVSRSWDDSLGTALCHISMRIVLNRG